MCEQLVQYRSSKSKIFFRESLEVWYFLSLLDLISQKKMWYKKSWILRSTLTLIFQYFLMRYVFPMTNCKLFFLNFLLYTTSENISRPIKSLIAKFIVQFFINIPKFKLGRIFTSSSQAISGRYLLYCYAIERRSATWFLLRRTVEWRGDAKPLSFCPFFTLQWLNEKRGKNQGGRILLTCSPVNAYDLLIQN